MVVDSKCHVCHHPVVTAWDTRWQWLHHWSGSHNVVTATAGIEVLLCSFGQNLTLLWTTTHSLINGFLELWSTLSPIIAIFPHHKNIYNADATTVYAPENSQIYVFWMKWVRKHYLHIKFALLMRALLRMRNTRRANSSYNRYKQLYNNDVDSYVVVQINELIGLNLNTTFKFCLPEMFLRYQPRPQPVL